MDHTEKLFWKTEKRKLFDLKLFRSNPRQMSDRQAQNLLKSLKKFNLVEIPVIDQSNRVIAGNMRVQALQKINKNGQMIDVRVPSRPLTEAEAKEYLLRSNRNTGDWNFDLLANFPETLLTEVGFEPIELDKIFQVDASPQDDKVPEVKKTKIKLGDMFELGSHRFLCGDATKKEDVEKLMAGKKADMVFTDPPYGVNYGADQDLIQKKCGKLSRSRNRSCIINDDLNVKELAEKLWRPAFKNLYEFSQDYCSFYMTMCQGGDQMMMMMMMSEQWQIKHELIWVKSSPVFSMGRLDYDYKHEPILFGWKKNHKFYGNGKFKNSVWEISKPNKSELHPTMKPVELIENALLNSSERNNIVSDLFLGSGSTLIACEKTNRICYGMEIDPLYCQVVIDRWQEYTSKKVVKLNAS